MIWLSVLLRCVLDTVFYFIIFIYFISFLIFFVYPVYELVINKSINASPSIMLGSSYLGLMLTLNNIDKANSHIDVSL